MRAVAVVAVPGRTPTQNNKMLEAAVVFYEISHLVQYFLSLRAAFVARSSCSVMLVAPLGQEARRTEE